MTATFDPDRLAALLAAGHAQRTAVALADIGPRPQSVDDAYAVQAAVMARLGANGGFKTSRPDPARANVMAPIPATRIRPSSAHYAGDEMRLCGIELEIAFRVDRDLPERDAPDYDARLRAAVSVVPAIEIVDTRLADHDDADALTKLADNQSGFGLVYGDPVEDFTGLNLTDPQIAFRVDGAQIGTTAGQVPGDVDALQVLKDCLEVVGDHCGGLRPGMFVTTGSLSGLFWIAKGAEVRGSIAGLGDVAVTISE